MRGKQRKALVEQIIAKQEKTFQNKKQPCKRNKNKTI